jgi:hypothetical protein
MVMSGSSPACTPQWKHGMRRQEGKSKHTQHTPFFSADRTRCLAVARSSTGRPDVVLCHHQLLADKRISNHRPCTPHRLVAAYCSRDSTRQAASLANS